MATMSKHQRQAEKKRRQYELQGQRDALLAALERASDSEAIVKALQDISLWCRATKAREREIPQEAWQVDLRKVVLTAVRDADEPLLRALASTGTDFNACVYKRLPLGHAANVGNIKALEILSSLGALPDAGGGEAALGDLSRNTQRDLMGVGETPLIVAAYAGQLEAARWLIGQGASLSKADARGNSPLHWAANTAREDMARLLILEGANPAALDKDKCTPLMKAVIKGWRGPVAALLIETSARAGALEQGNKDGLTAAHLACSADSPELLSMLAAAGADLGARSSHGTTPLSLSRSAPWGSGWFANHEKQALQAILCARDELDARRHASKRL